MSQPVESVSMGGQGIRPPEPLVKWRFWAVSSLLVLASVLFLEVGEAAKLESLQHLFCVALSFVVVSTLVWEWKVFGDPSKPANALIHCLLFVAVACMILRLKGRIGPPTPTVLDFVSKILDWLNRLLGLIPQDLFELMRSPGVALLFIGVCLALCLRRDWAMGVLLSGAIIWVPVTLMNREFGECLWFVLGLLCLAAALWLQYAPAARREFWQRVYRNWGMDRHVRGDLELKYRLLHRMAQEERALSEAECVGLVGRALGISSGHNVEVKACVARVTAQLVEQDGLCSVVRDGSGYVLAPRSSLTGSGRDVFSKIAFVPKIVVAGIIALIWVLSPIDLLPDSIPIVGSLDDVVASLAVLGMAFRGRRSHIWSAGDSAGKSLLVGD